MQRRPGRATAQVALSPALGDTGNEEVTRSWGHRLVGSPSSPDVMAVDEGPFVDVSRFSNGRRRSEPGGGAHCEYEQNASRGASPAPKASAPRETINCATRVRIGRVRLNSTTEKLQIALAEQRGTALGADMAKAPALAGQGRRRSKGPLAWRAGARCCVAHEKENKTLGASARARSRRDRAPPRIIIAVKAGRGGTRSGSHARAHPSPPRPGSRRRLIR